MEPLGGVVVWNSSGVAGEVEFTTLLLVGGVVVEVVVVALIFCSFL